MTDQATFDLLRLTFTPGLGPILISRLISKHGSPAEVLKLSPAALESTRGIGKGNSGTIATGLRVSQQLAQAELDLAAKMNISLIPKGSPGYPALLAELDDAPIILYVKGSILADGADQFGVAIVGSRECSAYGIEQSGRFAGILARAGLTIVSGGARGIDTAAHRGALTGNGRTIAVLGCGLAHAYPPENAKLFDQIAENGAVVSELPIQTAPQSENFPGRNRIISGLSLGVLVVEAGQRSGALITARHAAEEHGREVMALPGRIDSPTSRGTLSLIKMGGAALVTDPGDVLQILESQARHHHAGTHASRFLTPKVDAEDLFSESPAESTAPPAAPVKSKSLPMSDVQRSILDALAEPLTMEQLSAATGLEPSKLRTEVTMMEVQHRVKRAGTKLQRSG